MIITKYGLELHRLKEKHIEMLRQWRNSDRIKCFMEYREFISPEQQISWFNALNPLTDFYFIIYYKQQALGMIHANHVNWQENSAHAGLFIYENDYIGSSIPVFASLILVDVFFYCFGLNAIYAKVAMENPIAINYNVKLGFKQTTNHPNKAFQIFTLEKENYEKSSKNWHKLAAKSFSDKGTIHFSSSIYNSLKPFITQSDKFELVLENQPS